MGDISVGVGGDVLSRRGGEILVEKIAEARLNMLKFTACNSAKLFRALWTRALPLPLASSHVPEACINIYIYLERASSSRLRLHAEFQRSSSPATGWNKSFSFRGGIRGWQVSMGSSKFPSFSPRSNDLVLSSFSINKNINGGKKAWCDLNVRGREGRKKKKRVKHSWRKQRWRKKNRRGLKRK